jgi:hypothetical protein
MLRSCKEIPDSGSEIDARGNFTYRVPFSLPIFAGRAEYATQIWRLADPEGRAGRANEHLSCASGSEAAEGDSGDCTQLRVEGRGATRAPKRLADSLWRTPCEASGAGVLGAVLSAELLGPCFCSTALSFGGEGQSQSRARTGTEFRNTHSLRRRNP